MLSDPYYGLSKYQNYIRWQALKVVSQENLPEWNKKLAWQAELRTAFGLTFAQVQQLTSNWNSLYSTQEQLFYNMQPTNSTYANVFGSAYWQWANAYTTMAIPSV